MVVKHAVVRTTYSIEAELELVVFDQRQKQVCSVAELCLLADLWVPFGGLVIGFVIVSEVQFPV